MQESIVFSGEIDDRSLDRAVDDVNDEFADAGVIEPGVGGVGGGGMGGASMGMEPLANMAEYRNVLLEELLDEAEGGGLMSGDGGGGGGGGFSLMTGGAAKALGLAGIAGAGITLGGAGLKSAFENAGGLEIAQGDMPTFAEMVGSASIAFGGPIGGLFSGAITDAVENINWPELPPLSDLSWPNLPTLSDLSWPDLPLLSELDWPELPSLSDLEWPELPTIEIEKPPWLSRLPGFDDRGGTGGNGRGRPPTNVQDQLSRGGGRFDINLQERVDIDVSGMREVEDRIDRQIDSAKEDIKRDLEREWSLGRGG